MLGQPLAAVLVAHVVQPPVRCAQSGRCEPHGIAQHSIGDYSSKTTNCDGKYADFGPEPGRRWVHAFMRAVREFVPNFTETPSFGVTLALTVWFAVSYARRTVALSDIASTTCEQPGGLLKGTPGTSLITGRCHLWTTAPRLSSRGAFHLGPGNRGSGELPRTGTTDRKAACPRQLAATGRTCRPGDPFAPAHPGRHGVRG